MELLLCFNPSRISGPKFSRHDFGCASKLKLHLLRSAFRESEPLRTTTAPLQHDMRWNTCGSTNAPNGIPFRVDSNADPFEPRPKL